MKIYIMREEQYDEMAATMHTVEHVYIWSAEHVKKLLTASKKIVNVYDNVATSDLIVSDLGRLGIMAFDRWGVIEVVANSKPLAPVYDIADCKYLKHRGKSAWDTAKIKLGERKYNRARTPRRKVGR